MISKRGITQKIWERDWREIANKNEVEGGKERDWRDEERQTDQRRGMKD